MIFQGTSGRFKVMKRWGVMLALLVVLVVWAPALRLKAAGEIYNRAFYLPGFRFKPLESYMHYFEHALRRTSIIPGRKLDASFFKSWHIWAKGSFQFTFYYIVCAALYRRMYKCIFGRDCSANARIFFVLSFSFLCCLGLHTSNIV